MCQMEVLAEKARYLWADYTKTSSGNIWKALHKEYMDDHREVSRDRGCKEAKEEKICL